MFTLFLRTLAPLRLCARQSFFPVFSSAENIKYLWLVFYGNPGRPHFSVLRESIELFVEQAVAHALIADDHVLRMKESQSLKFEVWGQSLGSG